ncbi:ParB/RepB/Spo0J family partition protein [Micromonospora aurantiaca]|uniref:ParB/RepB/Spo0J family partition protein n=1 Tax=Micromonospora aurantiaca (nom. illeg.) TaxID=47850 RepID=UPI0033BD2D16
MDVSALRLDGSLRLAGLYPDHVENMVAARDDLPPIVVHRPTMRVIDGAHRVRAALQRGKTSITGRFFDGSEAEAFVLSVSLNVAHGLPLALADRKRAAERIAGLYPQWSNRRVAAAAGISPGTVGDIRRRLAGDTAPGASRIGKDGRVRPLDSSAGRRLAGRLMTDNPNMSLRQVAKAAAISPETARDVRNRLLQGAEVVPTRRPRGGASAAPANGGREPRPLNLIHSGGEPAPALDRSALVQRLMADPALRYSETGRNLLRLLTLHARWAEEWDTIVDNVPPHCTDVVADLACQFADLWAGFATRVGPGQRATG